MTAAANSTTTNKLTGRMAEPDPDTSGTGHLRLSMVKKLLVGRQDHPAGMTAPPVANQSSTPVRP